MNCLITIIINLKVIKEVLNMTSLSFRVQFKYLVLLRSSLLSEILMSEDELICALKNMPKNKSPGNDALIKEFYEKFWDDLTIPFFASIRKSFLKEELRKSQKQPVIRLT